MAETLLEDELECEWCGTPYPRDEFYQIDTGYGELRLCVSCRPRFAPGEQWRENAEAWRDP